MAETLPMPSSSEAFAKVLRFTGMRWDTAEWLELQ
jgi:hypothetical protein